MTYCNPEGMQCYYAKIMDYLNNENFELSSIIVKLNALSFYFWNILCKVMKYTRSNKATNLF